MDRQWLQVRTFPCEPSSYSIHTQLVGPQVVHSPRIVRFRSTAIAMMSCSLLFSVDVPIGIRIASVNCTCFAGLLPWLDSLTAALLLREVRILGWRSACTFWHRAVASTSRVLSGLASAEQSTGCLMKSLLKLRSAWIPGQQDASDHALVHAH